MKFHNFKISEFHDDMISDQESSKNKLLRDPAGFKNLPGLMLEAARPLN